jgi:outer membrane protein OmpA-like peptidoglycan-associated protein/opacity protein-like surface antigen
MRSGARIIITMAVAFLLAPTLLLCADDMAKPTAAANKDGPGSSAAAIGTVAKGKVGLTLPAPLSASPMPQMGSRRHSSGADDTTFPKAELFLGYSYVKNVPNNAGNRIVYLHGGSTSIAYNVNRHLGLVADFGFSHADKFGPNAPPTGGVVGASGDVLTFMFGPRLSFRHKVTPFVQALFGGAHATAVTLDGCSGIGCTPLPFENSFAIAAGGGLDITLNRHVALRLIQAEYMMTRFGDRTSPTLQTTGQNDLRLSVGLVFRFGGNRPTPPPPPPAVNPPPPPPPAPNEPTPNRPPTLSCSADRSLIVAGERTRITATASSPDNNPLTYSWRTNGGQIFGSGSSVTFDSSSMAPGRYTVTGRVDDGRGGAADCSVDLNVQAAQASAPEVLERTLALHSIYFPTGQPTEDNPGGGLVVSQQTILRALAEGFKKYLEFKPDARLTLEGHADERASVEYNNALAERRVAQSKTFLIEQGVPEASIETRSFGKHEQLDASQVRQQMEANPDLTPEQRQRLDTNLRSIILAQNRRVDVVLSTTGQKSTRRYPFNALDALTLLDDRQLAH